MKLIDLTGKKFGRLTVEKRSTNRYGRPAWNCKCECGKETIVSTSHLRSGHTQSCGCFHKEILKSTNLTHGHTAKGKRSWEFSTWVNILTRCNNKKVRSYKDYGAKGIKVCERWSGDDGFENFFADMGPRPSLSHSIGRKLNHVGYEPGNCQWETKLQQGQNTSRVKNLTYNGKTQCVSAWCRELGLGDSGIHLRLQNGWSLERALSTPKMGHKNKPETHNCDPSVSRWWLAD